MKNLTDRIGFEIEFFSARSGGKGGQNVNKTNSKAELRWNMEASVVFDPEFKARLREIAASYLTVSGEILLTSQESRDYRMNVNLCLEKLEDLLIRAARVPRKRVATKPTRSSQRRRLDSKRRHQEKKRSRRQKFD